MKTTQKGSAAVIFVIVILILLIAGAEFAYKSVANEDTSTAVLDMPNQEASVSSTVASDTADVSIDDISADIDASLATSDDDIKAINSEFKQ